MSARPFVPRLEGEELDLLISRSLDGDLSPEETRDLETLLADDAAARRRREELAGLVAEARALPAPAPPFALSTRVNANVSEKAARGGSVFHRFGFYPPPGMAIGAMVVLGFVAVAITVMNPGPKPAASTSARRADGPVDVFFQEGPRAKDASRDAAKNAVKDAVKDAAGKVAVAPAESANSVAAKIASKEKAREKTREEGAVAQSAPASEPSGGPASHLEAKRVASVVASNEPALDEKQMKLAKTEADADADARATRRQGSAESPALAGAAPAAPAPAARAPRPLDSPTWSVAIRGEGARRWMLRRAPEGRPPLSPAPASSFRVTLDTGGRVTAVRALDARAVQPALLEFVRGLVFAPRASVAGALAEGFARGREQKPNEERTDELSDKKADPVAGSPSEIEVEVSAR